MELVFSGGDRDGETLAVEAELVLGREGVDVVLADPEVSRRHAAFRARDGELEVEDLGSRNGTFVNDDRITGVRRLARGDVVRLGTTQLEVRGERPPPAPPTAIGPRETVLADQAPARDAERAAPQPAPPPPQATARRPAAPPPPEPAPPPAPAEPARPAPAAVPPPAAFAPEAGRSRRERRGAATRRATPTILSLAVVFATAAALLVYFAAR